LLDTLPAVLRIGYGARAAHKGDSAVTQLMEVPEGSLNGPMVVEHDVGHVLNRAMSGDRNHGDRHRNAVCRCVQQQKSVDSTLDQHARILLDKLFLPVVTSGEIEIVSTRKFLNDTAHYSGKVAF